MFESRKGHTKCDLLAGLETLSSFERKIGANVEFKTVHNNTTI